MYKNKRIVDVADLLYVWRDSPAQRYVIHGLTFRDFLEGVQRPMNLLLLRHDYEDAVEEWPTPFARVPDILLDENEVSARMTEVTPLCDDSIYDYGDFYWVD